MVVLAALAGTHISVSGERRVERRGRARVCALCAHAARVCACANQSHILFRAFVGRRSRSFVDSPRRASVELFISRLWLLRTRTRLI